VKCRCGFPRDEAWILPDDPPEIRDAKYSRYGARSVKCVACAARDGQQRAYEASAVQTPDGKSLLDRDGIVFPVTDER
jgi:hypothetical protein